MPETPVPIPMEGEAAAAQATPPAPPEPIPETLMEDAVRWAIDSKLASPLDVSRPERIDYPVSGHGYSIVIREQEGKQRLATAKFNADGSRALWTMDNAGTP